MKILSTKIIKRAIIAMAPFLFVACEKPNEQLGFNQVIGSVTGLDAIVYDGIITYPQNVDSLLVGLTLQNQSLIGGYGGNKMAGAYLDPHFGRAEASFVSQMSLGSANFNFGDSPVVDSVFLFLKYEGAYGDTSVPMNLEVYELAEALRPNGEILGSEGEFVDSGYYSDYQPVVAQKIGGKDGFVPRPNTPVRIEGSLTGATLKIPMDLSFFQTRFADVGDGTFPAFASNEEFVDYFKGIQVKTTTADGSILYFNLNDNNSRLLVYYHNSVDNTPRDIELNFLQDNSPKPIGFNIFHQDYSSAAFDLESVDSTTVGEELTYVQAMGGVATIIKIPGLDTLAKKGYLINQAILEVHKASGTGSGLPPPPRLEIREFNDKGPGNPIPDFSGGNATAGGGNFVSEEFKNGHYKFNITRYIFDVANGGDVKNLAIVPYIKSTVANRLILAGGNHPVTPMQLKVYITKP